MHTIAFAPARACRRSCPLWPDVEDPSALAAAQALPNELHLFAPPWLMGSFNVRGSTGAWLPDADGRVAQVCA